MDVSKAKLCCSLRWLATLIPPRQLEEQVDSDGGKGVTVKQLLLSPYQRNSLREGVVKVLTTPSLYVSAHGSIVTDEILECGNNSFWPLIQSLAKRGIYILDEDEAVVNHTILSQRSPFKQASHLALLDSLMTLYSSTIVTVERVVKTVKCLSTFNASRELPSSVDDSLILWLNKVSECLCKVGREEASALLLESDPLQRRRNKVKLMNTPETAIPPIDRLGTGITDGQCLAALLLHYCKDTVKCSDFYFGERPLLKQECLHNLTKVEGVYSSILSSGAFHLSPGEILKWSGSHVLDCNVRALLSHLYQHFEVRRSPSNAQDSGVLKSSLSHVSQKLDDGTGLVKRPNLLRRSKVLSRTDNPQKTGNESSPGVQSMNTVFKAPIRNSQSVSQFAILSQFNSRPMELGKGRQTQSSPSIHVSTTLAVPPKLSKDGLITASADNLMIREQMMANKRQLSIPRRSATSTPSLPQSLPQWLHQSSPLLLHESTSPDPEALRRSFTVDKQHTIASANAAGLPIIENDDVAEENSGGDRPYHIAAETVVPTEDEEHVGVLSPTSGPPVGEKSGSTSSTSSTLTVMHLSFSPEDDVTESSFDKVKVPSIPPSAFEQLQLLLTSLKKSDVLRGSQPIGQEVCRSYMHLRVKKRDHTNSKSGLKLSVTSEAAPLNRSAVESKHIPAAERPLEGRSMDGRSDLVAEEKAPVERNVAHYQQPSNDTHSLDEHKVTEEERRQRMEQLVKARLEEREKEENSAQQRTGRQLSNRDRKPFNKGGSVEGGSVVKRDPTKEASHFKKFDTEGLVQHGEVENEERRRKELLIKARLEEREWERKKAIELRRREQENKRDLDKTTVKDTGNTAVSHGATPTRALEARVEQTTSRRPVKRSPTPRKMHSSKWSGGGENVKELDEEQRHRRELLMKASHKGGGREKEKATEQRQRANSSPEQALQHAGQTNMRNTKRAKRNVDSTARVLSAGASALPRPALDMNPNEERRTKREVHTGGGMRQMGSHNDSCTQDRQEYGSTTMVVAPSAPPPTLAPLEGDTVHFKLSSCDLQAPLQDDALSSHSSGSTHGKLTNYRGPECYIKPQTKSNRKIIKNAICYVCLAGEANLSLRQRALAELEVTNAVHIFILLRDVVGFKFRGLYSYVSDTDQVTKIFGSGPKVIKETMLSHLYKYNSGLKEFQEILSRSFSFSVDALIIKNHYWTKKSTHR